MVVGVWSESVGVVTDVEQEASIWLAMGGVVNGWHAVENNRCTQRIIFCLLVVRARCRRWVVMRGIVWCGM